ncbi:2492_t:CDS:1, partial [Racocetra persica]
KRDIWFLITSTSRRYIVPQTSEQQCACCVSRLVSIYLSPSYSRQSSSGVYDSLYSQQR